MKRRAPVWPASLLFLFLLAPAFAAQAAVPPARWTVDDVVKAESVGELVLSRDGRLAVWVRSTVETAGGEEKRVSNLWLTRTGSAESVRLTRGLDTVSSPSFSPDAATVAFLSDRAIPGARKDDDGEPKTQIWAIPASGGEAYPVTRLDRDVKAFGWKDAKTIVYVAPESMSLWEKERKEAKDAAVVVDDAERTPPVRLYETAIEDGSPKRLTRNTDWIDSVEVSPDGKKALVTSQRSLSYEYDQKIPPLTFLLDLATLEGRMLFEDGKIRPHGVRWAQDGSGFYLVNEYSRHPVYRTASVSELHFHELATGQTIKLDLGTPRGLGGDYVPTPDGCIALLADGVRLRPARFVRAGATWKRTDVEGDAAVGLDAWALSRDGRALALVRSAAATPPQLFVARLEGAKIVEPRKAATLNSSFDGKPAGRVDVVQWVGANGETVEGLLHFPLDWKEGERRPLVLDIHGGPTGVDRDSWAVSWASPSVLWRQKGAFVLQVNYHGSIGYGLDWVESIGGKYYELEIPDIEKGVDALIARGLADPERLATTGWSNGGILSVELITRTRRYKAASIGAADVEWFSDWGNVDFGASFDNYYFGASPLENPKVYLEKSPFFRLPSVTTPTLAFTGTADRSVPPSQSWSLFRALQQSTRTEARLVLFPGEPHGLRKIVDQRRKVEEEQAWFDRHLFGAAREDRESVKKGSPFASLLARSGAAREGGSLGRIEAGVRVPETIEFEGLEVGRFEVTRAQYAAFDPAYELLHGEDDLPITGVPFEKAKAYAGWLAFRTRRPFRLPTAAEAERLSKAAGRDGNTLDRWAGYAPNPEDASRLRRLASGLALRGALLLPAGSVAGTGNPIVFDLDGNAAEWAVGEEGQGVAAGPSADRPSEPRGETTGPASEYVGFRIVVGDGDGPR